MVSEDCRRQGPPNYGWFEEQLLKLLKCGAHAARLIEDAPELLEAMIPPREDDKLSPMERARQLEALLREWIILAGREFDHAKPVGEAMLALYGLIEDAPTGPTALAVRTEQAGLVFGIKARTFRRLHRDWYIGAIAEKMDEHYHAHHAPS
jgi:hypothetical protein